VPLKYWCAQDVRLDALAWNDEENFLPPDIRLVFGCRPARDASVYSCPRFNCLEVVDTAQLEMPQNSCK